jgi:16S rRNA (cytosine967-C5)-methyltransferase
VQDLAASLPARLVPRDAREVLDLCAAPGGKTMQLAAAGHRVTALDSSESRLARLRDNLGRTQLAAELVHTDALGWQPARAFDAILLDAPCSATGTFRRHPEVLYRARPGIIADNARLQTQLLEIASQWLKPGGTLVYSVCSLEPQEGEQAVGSFLAGHADFASGERTGAPAFVHRSERGWIRILPGLLEGEGGLDGFFIARLVRRG